MSGSDKVPSSMGQRFRCPQCPASYTTAVNLRAHQLAKGHFDPKQTEQTRRPEWWEPTGGEGVPLSEWIGQALGAASVCWTNPGGAGDFDSTEAGRIYEAVHAHVQVVIDEHSVQRATIRQLLNEVRTRCEAWGGVTEDAGWLVDRIDDAYVTLEGSPMLDGGREP